MLFDLKLNAFQRMLHIKHFFNFISNSILNFSVRQYEQKLKVRYCWFKSYADMHFLLLKFEDTYFELI